MSQVLLGEARWPEASAGTLLVPLGSTEQHGLHLPLDTDTRIAEAIARRVAAVAADTVVAPPLAYGASGEHEGFPGTVSIGSSALHEIVVELVRSATRTFPRVVLVSGHGGNLDGIRAALRQLHRESRDVLAAFAAVPGGDAHAGRTETSLMLALAPQLVSPGPWLAGATAPIVSLMPRLRSDGVASVSPTGVLGNPTGANATEGRYLLDRLVKQVTSLVHSRRRVTA